MISVAHTINPVVVDHTSDLIIAQPITFATMGIAKEFSKESVEVNVYAIQYHDEERIALPQNFIRVPDLTQSIADIKAFKHKRKLPLIKDILDALYGSSQAEYYIYTNVDIALQPYFYRTVSTIIEQGYDAFIINRRTIPGKYKMVEEIPLMYAETGEKHKGWDCFVFLRSLYPRFRLGTACIGSGWIGRVLITNMSCLAKKFKIFEDLHLTFHIGNEKAWQNPKFDEYIRHNRYECGDILAAFEKEFGLFDRRLIPGRFLTLLEKVTEKEN